MARDEKMVCKRMDPDVALRNLTYRKLGGKDWEGDHVWDS